MAESLILTLKVKIKYYSQKVKKALYSFLASFLYLSFFLIFFSIFYFSLFILIFTLQKDYIYNF